MKTHIQKLEAESIYILREAVAESKNPVMLYSIGKDSAVMLHIAKKAFFQESFHFHCCMLIQDGNLKKCMSLETKLQPKEILN